MEPSSASGCLSMIFGFLGVIGAVGYLVVSLIA